MREINNHLKSIMNITPTQKASKPTKVKIKKDYTKVIIWTSMVAITVVIWTIIYNLIF